MLGRLFRDHPRSLQMGWAKHGVGAIAIGVRMIGAGAACFVHALIPGIFTETAGRTITRLHEQMCKRKSGAANPNAWPDYEI
ncbi:MAG TPA: DUF6356 family protein [Sphingomicrobium sp.]|nr:DUF6356 family protein [Sphingomicrobium sp.]